MKANLLKEVDTTLLKKFKRFDKLNPHVYDQFVVNISYMISKGVRKSSAWLIFNKMRWDYALKTRGESFKISNDFIGLYARKFGTQNPKLATMFNYHKMSRVK